MIPFYISNVIPVYRYSDGTYPYTVNVKQTFEKEGMKNPTIIGYFTDKVEAEKYRRSMLDVTPNAKFDVKAINVEVKEKRAERKEVQLDFWGMPEETEEADEIELDFWGRPIETQKSIESTEKD